MRYSLVRVLNFAGWRLGIRRIRHLKPLLAGERDNPTNRKGHNICYRHTNVRKRMHLVHFRLFSAARRHLSSPSRRFTLASSASGVLATVYKEL